MNVTDTPTATVAERSDTVAVGISMEKALAERLDVLARAYGLTRSRLLKLLCIDYLEFGPPARVQAINPGMGPRRPVNREEQAKICTGLPEQLALAMQRAAAKHGISRSWLIALLALEAVEVGLPERVRKFSEAVSFRPDPRAAS